MTRLLKWELLALKGDFSAMPKPFAWDQSVRFSHFLNGYDAAGGMDPLAELANGMASKARETGKWEGSAIDLWLCLFFQHRAQRHMGSDDRDPMLDALCETLRTRLCRLPPEEANALAGHLKRDAI
ncbi:hypothetical protein [Mesorhizobium sp. M0586]|uniref:hypothetical protein n=1 Tax=unclassified Mesorhizobium TaxID=325217 RepID=UPI003339658F